MDTHSYRARRSWPALRTPPEPAVPQDCCHRRRSTATARGRRADACRRRRHDAARARGGSPSPRPTRPARGSRMTSRARTSHFYTRRPLSQALQRAARDAAAAAQRASQSPAGADRSAATALDVRLGALRSDPRRRRRRRVFAAARGRLRRWPRRSATLSLLPTRSSSSRQGDDDNEAKGVVAKAGGQRNRRGRGRPEGKSWPGELSQEQAGRLPAVFEQRGCDPHHSGVAQSDAFDAFGGRAVKMRTPPWPEDTAPQDNALGYWTRGDFAPRRRVARTSTAARLYHTANDAVQIVADRWVTHPVEDCSTGAEPKWDGGEESTIRSFAT